MSQACVQGQDFGINGGSDAGDSADNRFSATTISDPLSSYIAGLHLRREIELNIREEVKAKVRAEIEDQMMVELHQDLEKELELEEETKCRAATHRWVPEAEVQ